LEEAGGFLRDATGEPVPVLRSGAPPVETPTWEVDCDRGAPVFVTSDGQPPHVYTHSGRKQHVQLNPDQRWVPYKPPTRSPVTRGGEAVQWLEQRAAQSAAEARAAPQHDAAPSLHTLLCSAAACVVSEVSSACSRAPQEGKRSISCVLPLAVKWKT
jgi:hypothetical protein